MPLIEFAYNRIVHSSTSYSPFEIVYGFNPLTPLDLLPLPVDELTSLDGKKKADLVKKIHEQVKAQIEKRNTQVANQVNQGRRKVTFEVGDWVWLHLRKERFPTKRRSKLQPRGDGPFQVVACIGDNAYKLDLPGEYNVSATFNVSDLSPFDVGDEHSWTNALEEGRSDGNQGTTQGATQSTTQGSTSTQGKSSKDEDLSLPQGPITRSKAKRFKLALNTLIQSQLDQGTMLWSTMKGQESVNQASSKSGMIILTLDESLEEMGSNEGGTDGFGAQMKSLGQGTSLRKHGGCA